MLYNVVYIWWYYVLKTEVKFSPASTLKLLHQPRNSEPNILKPRKVLSADHMSLIISRDQFPALPPEKGPELSRRHCPNFHLLWNISGKVYNDTNADQCIYSNNECKFSQRPITLISGQCECWRLCDPSPSHTFMELNGWSLISLLGEQFLNML